MKFISDSLLLACVLAAFPVSTKQDLNFYNGENKRIFLKTDAGAMLSLPTLLISGCTATTGRQLLAPIPSGPYISVDKSSKLVTIPRPPRTGLSQTPLNCPHARSGLKRWHDPNTWGGSIPQQGQNVLIPANSKVLIDQTIIQLLGIVTVPAGSELIIGSNVAGINITATGFDIGGSLIAGSTTCRISTPITITLTGNRPPNASTQIPATTYKGIGVTGLISLHGKRFSHTWTRLSKSVEIGGTVLLLQEPVNWEIGQKIVLVTSAIKDSRDYNQNEVLTVTSVNNNPPAGVGSVIYVKEAAKFRHIANEYYQVEVGLLSRTIKIQGSAVDSEPTDPDPLNCVDPLSSEDWTIYKSTTQPCMKTHRTGFGGHVRVEGLGVGQVEGVEFYRMGQTNVKGRYPFHFHLLGNCPTCYVRDSSFHRSFYRCVAIHGTNNSTVSENVAFDVVGYCYYLEDGVEERNVISYNLAAHIHTLGPDIPRGWAQTTKTYREGPELTLPADVTASGFYITNVFNNIIGNAASGVCK
jgi:G8 domain